MGLFINAIGKAEVAYCHVIEATMVVMTAPMKPSFGVGHYRKRLNLLGYHHRINDTT
jgi:hypothetical protein